MQSRDLGFLDFARLVLDALDSSGIDYVIGGAIAVWAWGEPRTTQDFDLVIHLPVDRYSHTPGVRWLDDHSPECLR